ncbi:acyl-CoA carboxylase subunit epsilon [[Mycobacterium] crassicus]|uniref:Acyl-CoA carboxylase subunit epsilon n=1 Tax=[Mycobacterium] crassicus TaxID=2872309 RepID=A0ABU5XCC1_9MYCO|nr:acyl-CoA carboxylase subunit epsilon [Mycolicibacter sp. MYC098]MEB3019928.1 acyl-CoA carboxylase subunit epsilon [Mycolicibacter sp. MYC098]
MSDDVTTETAAAEHEPAAAVPHIQVLKGNPTDVEVAALVAVLGAAGGGVAEIGTPDRNMWGHPVDKLRFPLFSWQRITLLERTHMRR